MHQTQRQLNSPEERHDYDTNPTIQSSPTFLNKFFFFNNMLMLYHYIVNLRRETLYRYNDNFKPMLQTTRILQKFIRSKQEHSRLKIGSEIFHMQQRTIITMVILSIVVGLTSLVPIYFQNLLVEQLIEGSGNYYTIAVIVIVMFVRFNILNYTLDLSSALAINIKLYLQNTFMCLIFYIDKDRFPHLKNRVKYLDTQIIGEALFYLPYFITSVVIVVGCLVFMFLQIKQYAWIAVGAFVFFIGIVVITGQVAYWEMRKGSKRVAERQNFEKKSMVSRMRTAFQPMSQYVYQLLIIEKRIETGSNFKINLLYIFGQTMCEAFIVVVNIILYALVHQQVLANSPVYFAVLFITTAFLPLRYMVYGFFTMMRGYEAYQQIKDELNTITVSSIHDLRTISTLQHQSHIFAKNLGDCFQYEYNQMGDKKQDIEDPVSENADYLSLKTLKNMRIHDYDADGGQTLMVLSRLDSRPACSQYFDEFINKKPPKKSLAMIGLSHFMLPQSLKENILFYSAMDQDEFERILEITQLSGLSKQINAGSGHANEKYLRYSEWHQTRIEIARALFNNVDYLLLNRPCILEDVSLLKNVIEERRQKRKVTIIANNVHKYFFKLADKVLVLGKDAHEVGDYNQLSHNRLSLFNTMFLRHHQKVDHSDRIPEECHDHLEGVMELPIGQENPLELDGRTFFQFFSLIHRFAEFYIMVSLLAPLAVKAYASYLIGLGLLEDIYLQYLISGIVYLVLVFVRGVCISAYTNYASLFLYTKICQKNRNLNAHQILDIYQKPSVDFDFHIRAIDRNLVMDFQYAQSVLLQILTASVVQFVVQPIFMALQMPVLVIILYVSGFYGKRARAMFSLRRKQTRGIQKMINNCVAHSKSISHYQKINEINSIFHMQNKVEIIYCCNHEWLETSVRTFAEVFIIIFFLLFLIVMIKTVPNQGTNTSIVGLGCGLFIGLMYLNTFFLKCFRQMEISLVSLTLCMDALRGQPHLSKLQIERMGGDKTVRIETVKQITYKDVSLRYFKNICDSINLTIRGGDRIVMCGNSNSFKEMIFYILENSIFDRDEVQGSIIINGVQVTQFSIDKMYFLHANPIIPYIGNVTQALLLDDARLSPAELDRMLEEFFRMLQIQALFNGNSMVDQLTIEQKQIFQVFRAVKVEHCKVLIVVDGFDSIDMVSRRKLTRYLLNQSGINIIIETTNLAQIIKLYPRQLIFRNQKVTEQIRDPREAEVVQIDSMVQRLTRQSLNDLSKRSGERVITKFDCKPK